MNHKIDIGKIVLIVNTLLELLREYNARKKNPMYAFTEFISKLGRREP